MPVSVVAILTPKPDSTDAMRQILTRAVAEIHTEPGCLLYSLHEGDGRFVFIEQWSDAGALDAHNSAPAVTRMVSDISELLNGAPEILVTNPLPAGDPAKGTLRP